MLNNILTYTSSARSTPSATHDLYLSTVACWRVSITTPLPLVFGYVTVAHGGQTVFLLPSSSPYSALQLYLHFSPASYHMTAICWDSDNLPPLCSPRSLFLKQPRLIWLRTKSNYGHFLSFLLRGNFYPLGNASTFGISPWTHCEHFASAESPRLPALYLPPIP